MLNLTHIIIIMVLELLAIIRLYPIVKDKYIDKKLDSVPYLYLEIKGVKKEIDKVNNKASFEAETTCIGNADGRIALIGQLPRVLGFEDTEEMLESLQNLYKKGVINCERTEEDL